MADTQRRRVPSPFGAFDAAFDTFYVYDAFHNAGGFAAVPFVARAKHTHRTFDAQGLPRCAARSRHAPEGDLRRAHQPRPPREGALRPLCSSRPRRVRSVPAPISTGPTAAASPPWVRPSALASATLDRESDAFQAVYKQRTVDERINSQAKELGIERPYLRNERSITNPARSSMSCSTCGRSAASALTRAPAQAAAHRLG
ncbi:MAG: hypothetical protein U0641_04695 [Anaerolineae bacterium]